jgi:hypothetical protein
VGLGGGVFIDKQRTNVGRYVHVQEREREKMFTLGKDFAQEEEDDEEEEQEEEEETSRTSPLVCMRGHSHP